MLSRVFSAAVVGLEATPIEIEVDIHRKTPTPSFTVVGLGDRAIDEARERVRSAIKNSGLQFPFGKITVNLAPADLRKSGPVFDLAVALGIMIASGDLTPDPDLLESSWFIGELALDGKLRHINGVLPLTIAAREQGIAHIFLPECDASEAALVDGVEICPLSGLTELIEHIRTGRALSLVEPVDLQSLATEAEYGLDFKFIKGQEHVKRALEISAAGDHNILLSGPPGSGKTLLARAFRTILPRLSIDEALETTKLYSVAGMLPKSEPLISVRPFRSPHHTASAVALVGGGRVPHPGEISLAHRGVLFLDEFAEFPKQVLEVLRQPLEDGVVSISRAEGSCTFPAKFTLIAAMNPCPCGFHSDPEKECRCSTSQVIQYQKKISGPLLDRIDLYVEVPRVKFDKLSAETYGESSEEVRARVQQCRDLQTQRFQHSRLTSNSEMTTRDIDQYCPIGVEEKSLLEQAMHSLKLSARAYHRILKVARTIADLDGAERITTAHIAEAIQYRPKTSE